VGRVRVLPEVLAHQIAAGEIVERPASVVKELVENSIDAEGSSIRVYLEQGGTSVIRVADDGYGMSRDDAVLAFEHHATSKISSVEDLERITTLGFRGEALPSIASVSRVRLRTVERDVRRPDLVVPGTEIQYVGGNREVLSETAWPAGTEIVVEDLFFNVPARRKFLKTPSTELSHVSRLLTCYALAFPQLEFRLDHHTRSLIEASPVEQLSDRVFQLFGERLVSVLTPLDYESAGVRIHGFASLPHEQRNNGNGLYLFVNRRMVRDRLLPHAIRQAYRDLIPSSAYPVVILFIETDPGLVDVNVHPTKAEIRFRNPNDVHRAITRAIEHGLATHRTGLSSLARDIETARPGGASYQDSVTRSIGGFLSRTSSSPLFGGGDQRFPSSREDTDHSVWSMEHQVGENPASHYAVSSDPHRREIPSTAHLAATPVALGQFVESFIVAADREGILVIDQHVAHERILYDRALNTLDSTSTPIPVQKLLVPETLDLDPQQTAIAKEALSFLNANGFDVDWFGNNTLVVRGVPALARDVDPGRLFEQLLEELTDLEELRHEDESRGLRRIREKIAISLSCRAAIKINTPLTPEKIQWLLDELFRCQNPYTCPHGRPIVLRLGLEEVLRGFKRC
jgi:DNA mismatch repair protein MutL